MKSAPVALVLSLTITHLATSQQLGTAGRADAPLSGSAARRVASGLAGQLALEAPRVIGAEAAITLDGRLDEPAWQRATLLTGFSEFQPVDARPADDSGDLHLSLHERFLTQGMSSSFRAGGSGRAASSGAVSKRAGPGGRILRTCGRRDKGSRVKAGPRGGKGVRS